MQGLESAARKSMKNNGCKQDSGCADGKHDDYFPKVMLLPVSHAIEPVHAQHIHKIAIYTLNYKGKGLIYVKA